MACGCGKKKSTNKITSSSNKSTSENKTQSSTKNLPLISLRKKLAESKKNKK